MSRAAKKFKIDLTGRLDKHGEEYYFSAVQMPFLTMDLSNVVIHCFPWHNSDDERFGMELQIMPYEPRHGGDDNNQPAKQDTWTVTRENKEQSK